VTSEFDVVVIGSGATGGWAAMRLTEGKARVLMLESGMELGGSIDSARLSPNRCEGLTADEKSLSRQPIQSRHGAFQLNNHHYFVDDIHQPYETHHSHQFDWIRGGQEGGKTHLWKGQAWRVSARQFLAKCGGIGWPIKYEDLAVPYERAEVFLKVHGSKENLPEVPDGTFKRPYGITDGEAELARVVQRKWKNRKGIPVRAIDQGLGERYRGHAKWPRLASLGSSLAMAWNSGFLTIVCYAQVRRIICDPVTGCAVSLEFVDRRTRENLSVRARAFVFCASTIESVRVLLNSASDRHPHGIGGSSGLLGAFFCGKIASSVFAERPKEKGVNRRRSEEIGAYGVYFPFFRKNETEALPFSGGYGIWAVVQDSLSPSIAVTTNECDYLHLAAFGEMQPRRENRISLSEGLTDAWGIPSPRIDCAKSHSDVLMEDDQIAVMEEIARHAGFNIVSRSRLNPGLAVHEVGGARMGEDSKNSVVNSFCECWDAPNVVIPDGACWPTSFYQSPTLTMLAITDRACTNLLVRMSKRPNDRE
jgi:choline dehydrogenase-like flavoprotein